MARNVELWARQNAGKSGIFPSRCERWRGPAGPRVASGPSRPGRRMRGGLAHEIASVTGFFRVRAQGSHFGFAGSHFAFLLGAVLGKLSRDRQISAFLLPSGRTVFAERVLAPHRGS